MKYVLFDLDRTLWDFDYNADITFRSMYNDLNIGKICRVEYDSFHEHYKSINNVLWEAYRNGTLMKEQLSIKRFSLTLCSFGLREDSNDVLRLARQMSDYYVMRGPLQKKLVSGAEDILIWLYEQPELFEIDVITNGFSEAQVPKMKSSGIYKYVKHVFLSEDIGYMKPHRMFFAGVLERLGAKPGECVVVGDDYKVDIAGAACAGIPQVYFNPQRIEIPAGGAAPTYQVHHLSELKEILRNNN